ncbi:protein kinase domain-containing protein [Saccharothrix sp. ST-888]|uniref:protein kinase domain-containing protein n=1 Tax=Saccharothrix sp. ST-888 TaxID=1427391 RepID=UPI000698AECF|nr:PQQ-binding-like beta-propeller repeat protein [Saccharothrix sp. ST-888]
MEYTPTQPDAARPQPLDAAVPQQPGPSRIGPYEVFQLLGEGGMGRVFLARSPGSRLVALKVIRPEYAEAPDFRGRFRREADAARKVSGFFTPPVLDADADAPQPWLATAYVPAPSLHEVVRRFGVLPEPALRALGTGLAEALLAIQATGIVHRDLKPGNVLVAHDGPRVIDFGISRALDATQVTRTDAVIGTPGFMAPEQITSGRAVGPAADVFSLGCVLVFAATGRGPFGSGGTAEILYRAVHTAPQLDGVPGALHSLLAACLDKDPARRPAADALLAALGPTEPSALLTPGLRADLAAREAHAAVLVAAPPLPAATPDSAASPDPVAPGRPSRRRFLWIAVGATAAAGAATAAVTGWPPGPGRTPAPGGAGAGTTVRPSPAVAAAPAPLWTHPLSRSVQNGHLALLGPTLVHWDQDGAVGYDAAAGTERWTASPRLPSDVSSGRPRWLGAYGDALYGTVHGDHEYLLVLDGDGALRASHSLSTGEQASSGDYVVSVLGAGGGVAFVGIEGDQGYVVRAVDLAAGTVLWNRTMNGSDFQATADGQSCFLQDNGALYGMDLRTGNVRWTARDVVRPGTYPGLAVAGNAVLVTGVKVQAFGAADGRELWTAVNESVYLSNTAVAGDRPFVADSQDTVFALDPRDGSQLWHTVSPLHLDGAGTPSQERGPSAGTSLVVAPLSQPRGLIAFNASDGKVRWAHQATGTEADGKTSWLVKAGGTTVYAASDTTLYAFRSDTA